LRHLAPGAKAGLKEAKTSNNIRHLIISMALMTLPITGGLILCSIALPLLAQELMQNTPGGQRQLLPSDAMVLDIRGERTSVRCKVRLLSPKLGFDLGFHVGYQTDIQLRDFIGEGDLRTVLFPVIPDNNVNAAVYFRQKWQVPVIPEDAKGVVTLEGNFIVGPGDYRVDWLIRDRRDRACSAYWRISARLPSLAGEIADDGASIGKNCPFPVDLAS
jgi:hypothetical protein